MGVSDTVLEWIHDMEETFDSLKQRWVREKGYGEPVHVQPYRGFGTDDKVWVKGRVLENESEVPEGEETIWENMARMWNRYESDEVPGAKVLVTVGDDTHECETNEEGYFELELEPPSASAHGGLYREIGYELGTPLPPGVDDSKPCKGEVIVPGDDARFLVVSDVDDTVLKTGATDLLRMSRAIFLNNAHSRAPFSGVRPFYRALAGEGGEATNPIVYLSSSPWNLYELFDGFLELHDLPRGPILLKEFGIDDSKFIKSGHEGHKTDWIARFAETWPGLPLILIGDSGQRDAWVYKQVVEDHPDRVQAIYLRHIRGGSGDDEVEQVMEQVEEMGVPMMLVEDSAEAAEHAAENGWIPESVVEEVREEAAKDNETPGVFERMLG